MRRLDCILSITFYEVTVPSYQPQLYFLSIFGFVIIETELPKCTKTRVKSHKSAYKMPPPKKKTVCGLRSPRPFWVSGEMLPRVLQ